MEGGWELLFSWALTKYHPCCLETDQKRLQGGINGRVGSVSSRDADWERGKHRKC